MDEENLKIDRALQIATSWMDSIDGVTGVGQGHTEDGHDAVIVYTSTANVAGKLPKTLEGEIAVLVKTTGDFEAQ